MFNYPEPRSHRRHGLRGYARHESYRPWVRDEFAFRCVYCLKRERWGKLTGEFDLDHFQPQSQRPDLSTDYANLVYACRRCNAVKGSAEVADPFSVMTGMRIRLMPDGRLLGIEDVAVRLILQLDLNSPRLVQWRTLWMRIAELARERDRGIFRRMKGFPVHLPNLRRRRPPGGNTRPEGLDGSWAALAERGELPDHY